MPTNKTYDNLEKMIFSGVGEYGIPEELKVTVSDGTR